MAKNQRYTHGLHIALPTPKDIKSGDPVQIGAIVGVAQTDASSGAKVTIWLDGSWTLPVAGDATVGGLVYIKPDGSLNSAATGAVPFGIALEAKAGAPAGPVEVALIGKLTSTAAGA